MNYKIFLLTAAVGAGVLLTGCNRTAASTNNAAMAATAATGNDNPIHDMKFPMVTARHKSLAAMAGDWTIEGQTHKGCPYGEGKFTAHEHSELMRGGQFLVTKTTYSALFKNSSQIAVFGVDPQTGAYTYSMFSDLGVSLQAVGTPRDSGRADLMNNAVAWKQNQTNVKMSNADVVYTTEMISPNAYKFSLRSGGGVWYDGLAKRDEVINPARPS